MRCVGINLLNKRLRGDYGIFNKVDAALSCNLHEFF